MIGRSIPITPIFDTHYSIDNSKKEIWLAVYSIWFRHSLVEISLLLTSFYSLGGKSKTKTKYSFLQRPMLYNGNSPDGSATFEYYY